MTVVKAGFIYSVRMGSGLVVAKLPDGSWSAPSAIGTAGMGIGGQIGGEITDFVIILNTDDAVRAFSRGGNVTLGGNLSIAAGPIGRSAEAASTVRNMAAVFSYSKTKGLFVGVSLEGSAIIERKDTNARMYGQNSRAADILSGATPRPQCAETLYAALDLRTGSVNPSSPIGETGAYTIPTNSNVANKPSLPTNRPSPPKGDTAIALYDFVPQRPDDLSFLQGDVIHISRKTNSQNDWWVGKCKGKVFYSVFYLRKAIFQQIMLNFNSNNNKNPNSSFFNIAI
jgi:lipid-binding SYLF domain-containing protein